MYNDEKFTAERALTSAANQILGVLSPDTSELVRARVHIGDEEGLAATDGVEIVLPADFNGHDTQDDLKLGIGLLAHELSHFLQPLKVIEETLKEIKAPHWLANVLMDVQGESTVESLFPPFAANLKHARQITRTGQYDSYVNDMRGATEFADMAQLTALAGRFYDPSHPFTRNTSIFGAIPDPQLVTSLQRFAGLIDAGRHLAANEIPQHLRQIMEVFPQLAQETLSVQSQGAGEGEGQPGCKVIAAPTIRQILEDEANQQFGASQAVGVERVAETSITENRPLEGAEAIARSLRGRLIIKGALVINAPGKIDRRALVRREPMPFTMEVKGQVKNKPKVVICLDYSSSMADGGYNGPTKFAHAQLAAQALSLAVKYAEGEAITIIFNDTAYRGTNGSIAFAPLYPTGGTSMIFLTDVWRTYPTHRIIVVSDGMGTVPPASKRDKARTAFVVIPDGDPETASKVADTVVSLDDPHLLPSIVATMFPRTTMA